jgi:hypothetical protein
MKWLFYGIWSLLIFVAVAPSASSQAVTDCPHTSGCIVISRDAALKALADADRVKALETEVKVKDEAIASFRDELNKMRVEFARVSGEATALKTNAVRDAAIIELLLKYARPKKFGLINLF